MAGKDGNSQLPLSDIARAIDAQYKINTISQTDCKLWKENRILAIDARETIEKTAAELRNMKLTRDGRRLSFDQTFSLLDKMRITYSEKKGLGRIRSLPKSFK